MFSVSELSAGLMKPLFNSTRKGTEAFITSSNEQTSIDRKKKKKKKKQCQSFLTLNIYVCVCVCVCIHIHTSDSKWGIAQFWIHFDIE